MPAPEKRITNDDAIIALAMIGAGLTATGLALGAAEVAEETVDVVEKVVDKLGNTTETASKVVKAAASFLGFGRKGGLF